MPRESQLLLGVTGQSLYLDTPDGRPSAAVVAIYDPAYREDDSTQPIASTAAATLTATLPAVNTTTSASASAGATSITLAATTSLAVDDTIRITGTTSEVELVRVKAINTSTKVVTLYDPLTMAHASGSTVTGIRTSVAIANSLFNTTTAWLGDEGRLATEFRVKWELTIGGLAVVRRTYFDLVRVGEPCPVTVLDVQPLFPDAADYEWIQQTGKSYSPQLSWVHGDVRDELAAIGYNLDRVRGGQSTLVRLCGYRWRWLLATLGRVPAGLNARDQEQTWATAYGALIAQCKASVGRLPFDVDDSGTLGRGERSYAAKRLVK